jgi:hypothetical protein
VVGSEPSSRAAFATGMESGEKVAGSTAISSVGTTMRRYPPTRGLGATFGRRLLARPPPRRYLRAQCRLLASAGEAPCRLGGVLQKNVGGREVRSGYMVTPVSGHIFVGEAMAGELVGVEPKDEAHWHMHLGVIPLGVLHERSRIVAPLCPEAV